MDEVAATLVGWILRGLFFIVVECFFFELFYYIGALPVWILSGRRLPTKDPTQLPRKDRRWYGLLGILQVVALIALFLMLQ